MPRSDIVFGSEFSPAVIELPRLLELAHAHQPNRAELQRAIDQAFFQGKGRNSDPNKTLGDNTILSMIAYGLLVRDDASHVRLSEFGVNLHRNRGSDTFLRESMGRHCLAELNGMRLVSCIGDLQQSGVRLKKESIATRLRQEGMHVPENGKHLNVLRQWLDYAGVLNPDNANTGEAMWTPDPNRIEELVGVTETDLDEWSQLTQPQYDFARAFALMNAEEARSSDVRDEAVRLYGTHFPEGGLPQSVLHQLERVGLITWEKTTSGRGAKSHIVRPTQSLKSEFVEPILGQLFSEMGPGYRRLSRMSLNDIVEDLRSNDRHTKGIALEALAFYFCRRLDLTFVQWRLRGNSTGGAEVDMVVESARLSFSRWQIQCKNTSRVSTEDLAKEVGVARAIHSNVIFVISTGDIGDSVRRFAKTVMENTSLHIILLPGRELRRIAARPAELSAILATQAQSTMNIKRARLEQ